MDLEHDSLPISRTEADILQNAREQALRFTQAGYAGCLRNGMIVDRRLHPEAIPVPANTLLGIPEPKPLEGAPPPEDDPPYQPPVPQDRPEPFNPEDVEEPKKVRLPVGSVLVMLGAKWTVRSGGRKHVLIEGPTSRMKEGQSIGIFGAIFKAHLRGDRIVRLEATGRTTVNSKRLPRR